MDRVAWTIIDRFRVASKLLPLDDKPLGPGAGQRGRPHHVRTAETMGLGTADPAKIDHEKPVAASGSR